MKEEKYLITATLEKIQEAIKIPNLVAYFPYNIQKYFIGSFSFAIPPRDPGI